MIDCDGPLLAAVGLVPSMCLPSILVSHHQYIQASLCIWLLLASCSGVLLWLRALLALCFWHLALAPCSGYCAGWALTWMPYEVITLWWVGRLLLNGCVSGLKEVRFVRSGLVRSMFNRPSVW